MVRAAIFGLGMLSAVIAAAPIAAGEVVYRFAGVVGTDGRDQNGVFVAPGDGIAGQTFTAEYRWNPSIRPAALTRNTHSQGVLGGPNFGSKQAIEGILTINGQAFTFGTELGSLNRENGVGNPSSASGFDQIGAQAYGNEPYLGITFLQTIVSSDVDFLSDADLINPLALTIAPLSRPLSSFSIQRPGSGDFSLFTEGSLLVSDFSVETIGKISVATVPEPTSWALLVAGFGMAGAMLRRRRAAGLQPV